MLDVVDPRGCEEIMGYRPGLASATASGRAGSEWEGGVLLGADADGTRGASVEAVVM